MANIRGERGWKDKKSRKQSKKDCRKDLLYTQCGEYSHIQVAVRSKSKISYILVPVPLQITFQIGTGQIGSASGSDLKNPYQWRKLKTGFYTNMKQFIDKYEYFFPQNINLFTAAVLD